MKNENDSNISGIALDRYFDFNAALIEFHNLFNKEIVDERAIAILGGTFLEMALEHILRAYLPDGEKEVNGLFEQNGPMATFSNKISLCFCLGLIDEVIKDDLTLVRKIRNKFAHDLYATFKNEKIKSWSTGLSFHTISMMMKTPADANEVQIFQVGVNQLISHLHGCIGMSSKEKREIKRDLGQFKL
jgi:hypothetical protein